MRSVVVCLLLWSSLGFGFSSYVGNTADVTCDCISIFLADNICQNEKIFGVNKYKNDSGICCPNCTDEKMYRLFCHKGTKMTETLKPLSFSRSGTIGFDSSHAKCKYLDKQKAQEAIDKHHDSTKKQCGPQLEQLCPSPKRHQTRPRRIIDLRNMMKMPWKNQLIKDQIKLRGYITSARTETMQPISTLPPVNPSFGNSYIVHEAEGKYSRSYSWQ